MRHFTVMERWPGAHNGHLIGDQALEQADADTFLSEVGCMGKSSLNRQEETIMCNHRYSCLFFLANCLWSCCIISVLLEMEDVG